MADPAPFSLEHFVGWAHDLVLDNERPFDLEDFQLAFLGDVLGGAEVNWLVVPEGSGKTTLVGAIALYYCEHTLSAFIPVGASSREQAEMLYRQAEGFVFRTPGMTDRFKCQEGYRRIKCAKTGGRIQVYAADDRTADGVIPSLAILDELHRHRDLRLYRTWSGKLQKRGGQIIAISTAGEPQSEFEAVRAKIIADAPAEKLQINGPHVRAEAGGMVLHDWAVRDEAQAEDMDVVAEANPRKAVTAELLAAKHSAPSMTPAHWLRFSCNIAASVEGGPWIPLGAWQACEEQIEIEDGAPVWMGIDLGLKHDTAALVAVHEAGEDRYVAQAQIIEPPKDGQTLDIAVVEDAVRKAREKWDVLGCAYDPWRFERSAQMLGDEGLLMIEHPMTNARMAPASEALHEAIVARRVVHPPDPKFAAHVNAGVPTETERGWRLTKRKAKDKIDALIALVIAYDLAVRKPSEAPATLEFA